MKVEDLREDLRPYYDKADCCHYIVEYRKENSELKEQLKKQQEIIDKINNYLNNYDVFKVFSFPLMKRWEEQEVKSSIDYEFKTSLIKDLKEILEDKEV